MTFDLSASPGHRGTPWPLLPGQQRPRLVSVPPGAYGSGRPTPTPTPEPDALLEFGPNDLAFASLRARLRASGGIARGEDLTRLLQDHEFGEHASLSQRIGSGEVLGYEWHGTVWVPMFQFDLNDLSYRPGPLSVIAELVPSFDPWRLVCWFVLPNTWLQHGRPVDLMGAHLPAVREAARADRFVATG